MKRYKIIWGYEETVVHKRGEWCKASDVRKVINLVNNIISEIEDEIIQMAGKTGKPQMGKAGCLKRIMKVKKLLEE
jgi:hypothetical protein